MTVQQPLSDEWPVAVLSHRAAVWPGFGAHLLRVRHDRPADFVRRLDVHSLFFNLDRRPVQMEARIEGGPVRRTPLPGHAWTLVPSGMTLRGVINKTPVFEHLSIQFPDAEWRRALAEAGADASGLDLLARLGADDPAMIDTARKLRRALAIDGAIGRLYGAQLGALIMTELALRHSTRPVPEQTSRGGLGARALRRVLEALDAAGPEGPDAATLVALAGVSRSHFFRTFKQSTGLSPERYLTERRVAQAREIIRRDPSTPSDALATAVGFSSVRHLRSAVLRVTGHTLRRVRSEDG